MSTHFLSLINGWIWSSWGLGAKFHMKTHFLSLGSENEYSCLSLVNWSNLGLGAQIYVQTVLRK